MKFTKPENGRPMKYRATVRLVMKGHCEIEVSESQSHPHPQTAGIRSSLSALGWQIDRCRGDTFSVKGSSSFESFYKLFCELQEVYGNTRPPDPEDLPSPVYNPKVRATGNGSNIIPFIVVLNPMMHKDNVAILNSLIKRGWTVEQSMDDRYVIIAGSHTKAEQEKLKTELENSYKMP